MIYLEKVFVDELIEILVKDIFVYKGNKNINILFKKENLMKEVKIDW